MKRKLDPSAIAYLIAAVVDELTPYDWQHLVTNYGSSMPKLRVRTCARSHPRFSTTISRLVPTRASATALIWGPDS